MDNKKAMPMCPLCGKDEVRFFYEDITRVYLRCVFCELIFVPERYWLSMDEERAVYDLHENDPLDEGYRKFLSRLTTPLLEKLGSGKKGLDFGCGPGPALFMMMEEKGHRVDLYDPFYYNDVSVFDKKYDFVCATEVLEHLRKPKETLAVLFKLLKRSGWLGLMTKLVIDRQAFRTWHYIRDMTHICFYQKHTFEYIAKLYGVNVDFVSKDVILIRRKDRG